MLAPTDTVGEFLLLCHLDNGDVPRTSAGYNRDTAKTMPAVFNADSFPAADSRTKAVKILFLSNAN